MGRLVHFFERVEAAILAGSVLAMAGITIVNVFARNVFAANWAAAEELNQFLIVIVCFVGMSYAASRGRHIRMTAVYDQLPPQWRKRLLVAIHGFTAALSFFLAFHAVAYVASVERVSPVLGVPLVIVYSVAPAGLLLTGFQYTLAIVKNVRSEEAYLSFDVVDEYEGAPGDGGE